MAKPKRKKAKKSKSRKASRKSSRKASRKSSRKAHRKASRKVSHKKARKSSRKAHRKASRKASRRVSKAGKHAMVLASKSLRKLGASASRASRSLTAGARKMGLTRSNPSMEGIGKDLMALLPEIGAGVASMAAAAFIASKVADSDMAKNLTNAKLKLMVPALASAGVAIGGYAVCRSNPKLAKFSFPVLMGGMAWAAYKALTAPVLEGALSISSKMGVPLGEYAAVGGMLDLPGGRELAVDGMGDYAVGEYAAVGSIFSESTLGEVPQMDEGRQPMRGTSGEQSAMDYAVEQDEGSLSGSIFD